MLNSGSFDGAEARMQQIENRIGAKIEIATRRKSRKETTGTSSVEENSFEATLSAMLNNQMLVSGFGDKKDDDSLLGGSSSNMLNMGMLGMLQKMQSSRAYNNYDMDLSNGLFSKLANNGVENARFNPVKSATLPVQGRVSSQFSNMHAGDHGRLDPVSGHRHSHMGVDIAAAKGSPIESPWSGQVTYVGKVDGFGKGTVIVAHPETRQPDGKILYSVFGHNDQVFVKPGDQIGKGQVFATVGSDGHSTGPHLHWETRWAQPNVRGKDIFKSEIAMAVDPLSFA